MQASELAAGRELDALVAERVMGWKPSADRKWWDDGHPDGSRLVAAFSTDIDAAWLVVERLWGIRKSLSWLRYEGFVIQRTEDGWEAGLTYVVNGAPGDCGHLETSYLVGRADTAPLAICRAAMAAVRST